MKTQLTVSDIHEVIEKSTYTVLPDCTTTICQLTLENGFTVIGKSACVDPSNFNVAIGEKYAFEDAFNKVWELEGYLLKQRLHDRKRDEEKAHD